MSDLRDAVRALRSTPVVTAVAVLSLALGIGANTAMFSILHSLLLRSLPVREPQQLAVIGQDRSTSWTNPIWEQVREHQDQIGRAAAWSNSRFNIAGGGETLLVDGMWVSGGYFDVLGVPAILGRTLSPADDRRGGGPDGPVAMIGYSFWQRRFNGAADVIGKSITVERVPFTIVGVTPPEFFGTEVGRSFDVAVPLGAEPLVRGKESWLDRRSTWWLNIMVRTPQGQTIDQAAKALVAVQPQIRLATIPDQYREEDKKTYLADPLGLQPAAAGVSSLRRRYQQPLTAIMIVVALVLLIACANVANLLLARATARRHELSIRVALGASRARIARQLLCESLLLSGAGALGGLAFARWGAQLLVRQLSTSTNRVYLELDLDWVVLAFTAGVAIATALIFGTAPALRATRAHPNDALKAQGRSVVGEGRFSLGNVLVIAQVALSLILVVAAGLFGRTFASLAHLDLGLDSGPVLIATVNTQRLQLEPAVRAAFFERLRTAAASTPGVASAATSALTPISGGMWNNEVLIPGGPALSERERVTYINLVSPDWLRTYGTRLLAGRDIAVTDQSGTAPIALVNEAFVRKFFNGENPVGRRVGRPAFPGRPGGEREIVGYVADAVYNSLREPVPPTMYIPITQQPEPPSTMAISVRAAGGAPALLARGLTAALSGVSGDLAITLRPLDDQIKAALTQERVVAFMSAFFGVLALLLAGLGLYGVTAYAVSRRRAEIGIRMALGAAPGGVLRLVLARVALLVGIGAVLGSALSIWAARFVTTLLYGLQPRDPLTLVAATLVLMMVGGVAGLIPARRAARLDPASVLRQG